MAGIDINSLFNLATRNQASGRLAEARAGFEAVLRSAPDWPDPYSKLGHVLRLMRLPEQALESFRRAAELAPNRAEFHANLGNMLGEMGRVAESTAAFARAIELDPKNAMYQFNMGIALGMEGRIDDAMDAYDAANRLRRDFAPPYLNLANALVELGRVDEAIAYYDQYIALRPNDVSARISGKLYSMHYSSRYGPRELLAESRKWDAYYSARFRASKSSFSNNRDPNRRLRIGYVSADFRNHPVGRPMLPPIELRDRNAFEVFCYSNFEGGDALTERFRASADHWRDTYRLDDDQLAALIRQDGIDIVVLTTILTTDTRLAALARKPAPVQLSVMDVVTTTGCWAMDYRVSDPHLDPTPASDAFYLEKSYRLPSFFVYYLPEDLPPVGPLPAARNGFVTFGCLNRMAKVSEASLRLWMELLNSVPNSRLIMQCVASRRRDQVRDEFVRAGVAADRVEFVGKYPPAEFFKLYNRVDISLDPFPYNGQSSLIDSLYMGVPSIALAGEHAVARVGISLLNTSGCTEFAAETPHDYIRIASELAGDVDRLAKCRATLRDRVRQSRLMDAPAFVKDLEAMYRDIWRQWCAAAPPR